MSESDIDTAEHPDAVTVSVARRADPDREDEMFAWVRTGLELASGCPGFLGGGWVRPSADSNQWHMMYRFTDRAALARWEDSKQRDWWLGSAEGMVRLERKESRTGIEGWFEEPRNVDVYRPEDQPAPAPPRWKQAITIYLVFFPLSLFVNVVFSQVFPDLGVLLRVFGFSLFMTPVMTYVALPFVTRKMAWFLEGRPPPWRRTSS